jgi:PKD repeat protein
MEKIKISIIIFIIVCFTNNYVTAQIYKSPEHTPPTAQYSIVNLCYGDSARFINQSLGGATNLWIIRYLNPVLLDTLVLDTIPTLNLTYYFSQQGTYFITLQEDNGHIVKITKTVIVNNTPKANFSFENCSNNMINMSTCATSYYWDFGDGSTSTAAINNHPYADTGYYQVKCIVTNGAIYDTLIKQIYVSDIGYPKLTFTYTLSNDTLYGHVTSTLGHYGNVTWYFGDSFSANQANVIHVYKDSIASYNFGIRVYNSCGMIFKDTIVSITSLLTGVESDNLKMLTVDVFPNPTTDVITIKQANIESITIYNLQGQKEYELKNSNNASIVNIDIKELTEGIHFIQIKTKTNLFYSKSIKLN